MSEASSSQATTSETVRCDTWEQFVTRCANDLARGGMFIETMEPHTVWNVIGVRLCLPAGHEVELQGRVVHVIDAAAATQKQTPPGIGVEFIDLDGPRAGALAQLLEYARTEGSRETPQYTFAQWLSTTAVSQAPSELMASLPPAPQMSMPPATRSQRDPRQSQQRRRTDAPPGAQSETSSSTVRRREAPQPSARTSQRPAPRTSRQPAATSKHPPASTQSAPETRSSQPPEQRDSIAPPTPKTEDMHSTLNSDELKLGMTHLAHRRYREASTVFNEMISSDPSDRDARLWLHMAEAREAVASKRSDAAIAHYRKVLVVDQHNREASDKIKALQKGGNPFGRFFSKK